MDTQHMNSSNTPSARSETLLGKALAAGIAGNDGPCPDIETVAALVDGKLTGEELNRIQSHVASCEDCLRLFTMTAASVHNVEEKGGKGWLIFPSAVAVAVLLVIAVKLTFNDGAGKPLQVARESHSTIAQVPPDTVVSMAEKGNRIVAASAVDMAAAAKMLQPAKGGEGALLSALRSDESVGFVQVKDPKMGHRLIGTLATRYVAAIEAGDSALALTQLSEAEVHLAAARGLEAVHSAVKNVIKGAANGGALPGSVKSPLNPAVDPGHFPEIELGAWAEAARIAAVTGQDAFLESRQFVKRGEQLLKTTITPSSRDAVKRLMDSVKSAPPGLERSRSVEEQSDTLLGKH